MYGGRSEVENVDLLTYFIVFLHFLQTIILKEYLSFEMFPAVKTNNMHLVVNVFITFLINRLISLI